MHKSSDYPEYIQNAVGDSEPAVIFWDYNGTILDDVGVCVSVINTMLNRRNLPAISYDKYINIFDFPIIRLYEGAGFNLNKESFTDALAPEYISLYQPASYTAALRPDALNLIKAFRSAGYIQVLLSASQKGLLLEQIDFFGLSALFDVILGLSDIYAKSKTELARHWINEQHIDSRKALVIGDTIHDYQVACELNCRCILVCGGHNSKKRLQMTDAAVIDNLSDLLSYITQ